MAGTLDSPTHLKTVGNIHTEDASDYCAIPVIDKEINESMHEQLLKSFLPLQVFEGKLKKAQMFCLQHAN